MNSKPILTVPFKHISNPGDLLDPLNWENILPVTLREIRPESSDHIPHVKILLFRDHQALYGKFSVDDRYVRCVQDGYQAKVSKDSCVEFFLKPAVSKGYFNFEFSCGGNLLCYYIRNPQKKDGKRIDYDILSREELDMVHRQSTLPSLVPEEITTPLFWELAFMIPFDLIQRYTPLPQDTFTQIWKANFYKCGDETSHPHWISWTHLPEKNFHRPDAFGLLQFEKP